jgi:hypothetical protein
VRVLKSQSWRVTGKVITIAHEGGHALVSVLSGRRLDGIRLHSDSSGVTYSRGRRTGPGLVLTAAAGYVMPSLLGAGAALLLAERHLTAMLWLALVCWRRRSWPSATCSARWRCWSPRAACSR